MPIQETHMREQSALFPYQSNEYLGRVIECIYGSYDNLA